MARQHIFLGKILGIPIYLDYSWFLIFVMLTWLLARNYYPAEFATWPPLLYWIMGTITAIMLFVSVLLHELGHSIAAQYYQISVKSITLMVFGGVAQITAEPKRAGIEFVIAIAGPLVSFILAALFYILEPMAAGSQPLWGLFKYLAYINLVLALFNLIPGFPLDGGRIFRALVWGFTKNMRRATILAANTGRFIGFLFIGFGVLKMIGNDFSGGLWIAFIGWFLESAAASQIHQFLSQDLLQGHTVGQIHTGQCTVIPARLNLQKLVDDHILQSGRRCFLVSDGENTLGLITLHKIRDIARPEWPTTTVEQIMIPLNKLKYVGPETGLWTALQEMDHDGVNQLPIIQNSKILGILSRENIISFIGKFKEINT